MRDELEEQQRQHTAEIKENQTEYDAQVLWIALFCGSKVVVLLDSAVCLSLPSSYRIHQRALPTAKSCTTNTPTMLHVLTMLCALIEHTWRVFR